MRMDCPNGVHNEERTFLDRITQLKSILRNRCADGRWSCHLDGAVLAGRFGTGARAAPGEGSKNGIHDYTEMKYVRVGDVQ